MKKPIKTSLSSSGKLPSLIGRELRYCVDYVEECVKLCRNPESIRQLSNFVGAELANDFTKDLDIDCKEVGIEDIISYRLEYADKPYVYRLELVRDGSSLTKIKKLLRKLLSTTSEFNNLSGTKHRRYTNRYSYTIDIDCSDGRYPSVGIPRLVRLLNALNEY